MYDEENRDWLSGEPERQRRRMIRAAEERLARIRAERAQQSQVEREERARKEQQQMNKLAMITTVGNALFMGAVYAFSGGH